jgi:hypothetical protein
MSRSASFVLGVVAVLLASSGCVTRGAVLEGVDGGVDGGTVVAMDGGVDAPVDAAPTLGEAGEPLAGLVICGGVVCADGQECCLLTGACVTIGDPSCAVPADTTVPHACARNADCASNEICEAADWYVLPTPAWRTGACTGVVGRCFPRRTIDECGGVPAYVCGCDGRTYENVCEASAAGVRVGEPNAACGVDIHGTTDDPQVACGVDAQCPSGQLCCTHSGYCYDASRPEACGPAVFGTFFQCGTDDDCRRITGAYWGLADDSLFCDTDAPDPTCGTPGGGCRRRESSCFDDLAEVCGCDGTTYRNDCYAWMAGVRRAHDGACP